MQRSGGGKNGNDRVRFERGKASVTGIVAWLALLIGVYNACGGYWGHETARWNHDTAELNYRAAIVTRENLDRLGVKVRP